MSKKQETHQTSKGIVYKRRQAILKYLKNNHTAKTEELSELLLVSPTTIRRDFQALEKEGIVERFYGGAKLVEGALFDDPSLLNISEEKLLKREKIAEKAASYIEDGDTIFINSSSTALLVLKYLEDKRVVVVTNNGKALQMDLPPSIELVLTGGEVYSRKQSMVGDFALQLISKITATKSMIGVSGITADYGISTSVLQETIINKKMLTNCSGPTFVLTDSSKIGRHHNFSSGEIDLVSYLITDTDADPEELKRLKEKGVETILVDMINEY